MIGLFVDIMARLLDLTGREWKGMWKTTCTSTMVIWTRECYFEYSKAITLPDQGKIIASDFLRSSMKQP